MIPKHMKRNWKHGGHFGPERRGYHHGGLKEALVEAARALMAEHGPGGFTLAEAAKRVGVTGAAPYRHFADRWALQDALAAEGFALMRERSLAIASKETKDPRARIARLGEGYVGFAIENPHHFQLMFLRSPKEASADLHEAADACFQPLQEAIENAQARGLIRKELRKQDVVLAAWALVHGLASLVVGGQITLSSRALRKHGERRRCGSPGAGRDGELEPGGHRAILACIRAGR